MKKIEIETQGPRNIIRCAPSFNFALQRQHGNIIRLGGFADMGKQIGSDPLHEFEYGRRRFR